MKDQSSDQRIPLIISTPHRGEFCEGYVNGIISMMASDIPQKYQIITNYAKGVSDVRKAREDLSEAAKHMIKDHPAKDQAVILWIDSDTGFNHEHVKEALKAIDEGEMYVAIPQSKKHHRLDRMAYLPKDLMNFPNLWQAATSDYTIQKTERLKDGRWYANKTGFGFFMSRVADLLPFSVTNQDEYLSEDFCFCQNAEKIAEKIRLVCTNVGVTHESGSEVFQSSFELRIATIQNEQKLTSKNKKNNAGR